MESQFDCRLRSRLAFLLWGFLAILECDYAVVRLAFIGFDGPLSACHGSRRTSATCIRQS